MFNSERFSSYNIPGFGHRPTYPPAERFHHPRTDCHLPTPPATAASTTTSTKRTIGGDELESEIPIDSNKRVKVALGNTAPELSIDESVTPSTTDTTFLATPLSISGCAARTTRSTAENFMSQCAVNGLEACRPSTLETISTPAPSDDFDRSGSKIGRLVNTNSTACTGSASNDGISNAPTHDGILSEVPAFPVEAIKILQQASTDMLRLLVKKNAPDRERQLQVAVGTMRTCLEVEFVPHLEAWTNTPVEKSVLEVVEGKAIGVTTGHPVPVSDKKDGLLSHKARSSTSSSIKENKTSSETQEALRNQLSGAFSTIDKLKRDLRHRDEDYDRLKGDARRLREQRDYDYVKYKEEIKRYKAKLAVAEDAIKPCGHVPEIAGLKSRLEWQNTESQKLRTKLHKAAAAAIPKPCGHELELTAWKRDIDSKATKIKNQANTYNQLQALYNRLRTAHGGQPVTTQSTSKSNESGPGFSFGGEGAHTLPGSQQNVLSSQDRKAKKRGTAAAEVKASSLGRASHGGSQALPIKVEGPKIDPARLEDLECPRRS